jgi:hypothetical protein
MPLVWGDEAILSTSATVKENELCYFCACGQPQSRASMSVFLSFLISYREEITNEQFHEIIRAAANVDCFARFIPAGHLKDNVISLIKNFRDQINISREIILTTSSNPYDPDSDHLYDREMLNPEGFSTDSNVEHLAGIMQKFLLEIKGAERFLLVCSEGYDTSDNFAISEVFADQVGEHFAAIFLANSIYAEIPSLVLQGRWGN